MEKSAPRPITIGGVPLLDGQRKAVAIAMARLHADLSSDNGCDRIQGQARKQLLKLTSEVQDLIRQAD